MNHSFSDEFQLQDGFIHLNHAAVAPWPKRAVEAVSRFADENLRQGSWRYLDWLKTEANLRQQLASLISAPSGNDIALVKNTSEALSFVAAGVDWHSGENIVTSNQEFPSNRIVWESLASQGVELRQADLSSHNTPEDALFELVDDNTRMIAISSVQYGSGLCMDLSRLGSFCRDNNILFCVDAIQSIGALSFDAIAMHADFVAADGHKWLLGPEGLGLFYVRPELRNSLKLTQFGWHMVEDVGDFDRIEWQAANSARRFECGSPNMLSIHALNASTSLLLDVGMETVESLVCANTRYLMDKLGSMPDITINTSCELGRYAGIVNFTLKGKNSSEIYNALMEQQVFCASRAGGIRFSPHFHTSQADLDTALNRLESINSQ